MNHVYRYDDGTFLARHGRPVVDIQEAHVGRKASVAAKAGSVNASRGWKNLPKLKGSAVPVRIVPDWDEDFA